MAKTSTSFKKGTAPGRPKGAINKTTKAVKEVFATVFSDLQEDPKYNLKIWAKENTTEFYKLATKLIPLQTDIQQDGNFSAIQIIQIPDNGRSRQLTEKGNSDAA